MLYLLLKVFAFLFLAIIWYCSVVFLSFVERLAAKSVQCLLIVYKLVTGTRGDDKVKEKPPVTEASSSKSERTSSSASASSKKKKQQKV